MKHLIIDGMNFAHRARAGFQLGPHPIMFNFFRNLRALVEMHKPNDVFYVLEGHPKHRHEALPGYKANRELQADDPLYEQKLSEMKRFYEGNDDVLTLLMKCFPITVVRHPDFECDDTVHNLTRDLVTATKDEVIIASSDSDFVQTLQLKGIVGEVKLYNPMKKSMVEAPNYDYVTWKALRGDGSDNIPGVPGVGDKTATKLMEDPDRLGAFLQKSPETFEIFQRNVHLIRFHEFSDDERVSLQRHKGNPDWDGVKRVFETYNFQSITNDKSWKKFVQTFNAVAGDPIS